MGLVTLERPRFVGHLAAVHRLQDEPPRDVSQAQDRIAQGVTDEEHERQLSL